MAKGDKFKEINHIMGAPTGREDDVDQLGVCFCHNPQYPKDIFTVMRMKLTEEERDRVAETGEMWIGIMGVGMPPLWLTSHHPFKEQGYIPISDELLNKMKGNKS